MISWREALMAAKARSSCCWVMYVAVVEGDGGDGGEEGEQRMGNSEVRWQGLVERREESMERRLPGVQQRVSPQLLVSAERRILLTGKW